MKTLLKPTVWKMTLTLAFLIIATLLWRGYAITIASDTFNLGFPFQFYIIWGPIPVFDLLGFSLDLIFWYSISLFVIVMVEKRKL